LGGSRGIGDERSFAGTFASRLKATRFELIKTMATHIATFPATDPPTSVGIALPAFTLWWREIVRFYRQKARVVGVIASPLLFWVVIGSGFGSSFRTGSGSGQKYLSYFYPGALIMIVLFTSIFTMMSVIEDRKEGFLLSVLVAPVSRSAIVLGKVLGGTTLATIQGLIFLAFSPLVGVHLDIIDFLLVFLTVFLVSFALTSLGFAIAWPMDSTQAFHGIINLFLIPLWLLSGSMFPLAGASGWMRLLMKINPLTYGVEALRILLYPAGSPGTSLSGSLATLLLFALIMFCLSFVMVSRRGTKPAA
jgi:ABC-2 type transport system permease protein